MKYFLIFVVLLIILIQTCYSTKCCTAEADCQECEEIHPSALFVQQKFDILHLIEKMDEAGRQRNELIRLIDQVCNLDEHHGMRHVILEMFISYRKENEMLEYFLFHKKLESPIHGE